jgi:hypothetical protein
MLPVITSFESNILDRTMPNISSIFSEFRRSREAEKISAIRGTILSLRSNTNSKQAYELLLAKLIMLNPTDANVFIVVRPQDLSGPSWSPLLTAASAYGVRRVMFGKCRNRINEALLYSIQMLEEGGSSMQALPLAPLLELRQTILDMARSSKAKVTCTLCGQPKFPNMECAVCGSVSKIKSEASVQDQTSVYRPQWQTMTSSNSVSLRALESAAFNSDEGENS